MVKVNLKNKFLFLNKSKAINSNNSNFELENINTNANWFQRMEPVTYAKKNGKKLYKFKKIKINHKDTKTFKKLLFNDLKKQLDQYKKKIRQEFLRTSDGSLNVGLNVILIDSMLIEIINNTYQHVFGNIDFKLSIIAVGGYGRGELAPHSDLDLLFLIPDDLNKIETKNIEGLIKLILYLLWDLGYTVGHSTRTILECINESGHIIKKDKKLLISNVKKLTIFISSNSDFYTKNFREKNLNELSYVKKFSFEDIKNKHIKDFQSFYNRINFSLDYDNDLDLIPTDQRLKNFKNGIPDNGLIKILYDYGRYLR